MKTSVDYAAMQRLHSLNRAWKGPVFEPSAAGWVKPDGSCVKYHLSGAPGTDVPASERKSIRGGRSPFVHEWSGRDLCGYWGPDEGIRRWMKARLLLSGTPEELEAAGASVRRVYDAEGVLVRWSVEPGTFVDKGRPGSYAVERQNLRRETVLQRRAKGKLLLERYAVPKK